MTRTENYNLPQWEADDPVRREDFNGAMASIDAGLAAGAHTFATVNTYNRVAGDTVYTFDRAPRLVILFGGQGTPILIAAGSTGSMIDYISYNANYKVGFRLTGTALILTERTTSSAASSLKILAFY